MVTSGDIINWIQNWGAISVAIVTLFAIIIFNWLSHRTLNETARHLENQFEKLNELSSRVLSPMIDCKLRTASPTEISFVVTNTSGVEFVMRARLHVNDEPVPAVLWNYQDVSDFIDGESIEEEQLVKYKPARLYPELALTGSPGEAGGAWATRMSPGETRVFSTKPFPIHERSATAWVQSNKKEIRDAGRSVEEFEKEIGRDMNAKTRMPDLLIPANIGEINSIIFEPLNPNGVDPIRFEMPKRTESETKSRS